MRDASHDADRRERPMTRLLLVDDNSVDLEQARRLLSPIEGLEVFEASNGRLALEAIEAKEPEIVLSDIRMPEMDGLELVRECKERFPQLPVILMTSSGSETIAAQALQAGAASYVPKANMAHTLPEAVAATMAIAQARRQRRDVMAYFESSVSSFRLGAEPELISALAAHLQDDLETFGFADESVRSQIGTALMEALTNAMIHGNLEVGSELKDEGSEPYHRLIESRRAELPWRDRVVHCRAELDPGGVQYVIRDEGPGFDVKALPDPTRPESMLKARGRGLFLIHAFMDEVEHNEAGNEIRLSKRSAD